MKPKFATKVTLITVCKWVSPQCFADIITQVTQTGSRSNVQKEHTHIGGHKCNKTHILLQILGLFASFDPVWILFFKMIFVT